MKPNEEIALIVDDEADIREILCDYLRSEGFDVITAENGISAYQMIDSKMKADGRSTVSLVVSDWMMPSGDGIELLNRIRNGPHRDLPFVLISGAVSRDELQSALQYDPDVVILKPFTSTVLREKVRESILIREKKELARIKKALTAK